jgi:hypothetical protein
MPQFPRVRIGESMTRTKWVVAGAALAVAVFATVIVGFSKTPTAPSAQSTLNTATVERGTLTAMVSVDGTLTYSAQSDGSPYSLIDQAQGTYTELPVLGQVISQGQALYRVNDVPVVLLYGSIPAYRTMSTGAVGPDVAELNADLVTLGYLSQAKLDSNSASFGSATTAAVERLQTALGMPPNGTLNLGQAVFEPTPVRVTSLLAQLGGSTQPGQAMMQATSTARQVQVALDATQQTDMAVGDKVTITLPNNLSTPGIVTSVGTVATCASSSGASGSGSGSAAPGSDNCTSGSSEGATPTVTVDVAPSDPASIGTWDQAPVQVSITTARIRSALIVPVTALLARSGSAYAVEVVGASRVNHLVSVSLGLFDDADGLVQVTGSGLAVGQKIVVPSI